jgi:mRNA interferase MazF
MTSLRAGDIVWADFEPVRGTEQGGRRPAIVLTGAGFNSRDQRSIVCPITRNLSPWPTKVVLPPGLRTRGAVLVDQIRNMHREERGFRFIEHGPEELLADVRAVLKSILELAD